jgi:hypothetical protein
MNPIDQSPVESVPCIRLLGLSKKIGVSERAESPSVKQFFGSELNFATSRHLSGARLKYRTPIHSFSYTQADERKFGSTPLLVQFGYL